MSYLLVAILHNQFDSVPGSTLPGRRAAKMMLYPARKLDRRAFKQFRRDRGNPGRANRHIFTNKDMRSW